MGSVTYINRARVNVIDKNATLDNDVRAAADYDNDGNKDLACNVYLSVQWNTTAPTVDDRIAFLWVLPGDDEMTEVFPEGGDGTVGADDDPQAIFLAGVFVSVNPSITVDEQLVIPGVPLHHSGNRFVLKNTSGQQFDLTWDLDIVPYTVTVA